MRGERLRRLRSRHVPMPAEACSTNAETAAAWASIPVRISPSVVEVRSSNALSAPEKFASASPTRAAAPTPAVSISARRAASRSVASAIIRSASPGALGEHGDLLAEDARPLPPIRCQPSAAVRRPLGPCFGAREVVEQHSRCRCALPRPRGPAPGRGGRAVRCSIELAGDPAKPPVASSPSCISCCAIIVSSARLSPIRCASTSSNASSDRASWRIATTERVNRSASLRRVRPNISQARPSRASGPAATATHCATARRRQRLADERAAGRPGGVGKPQRRREAERDPEHLASASAALFALCFRPLLLVERRLRRLHDDVFDGQVERPPLSSGDGRGSERFANGFMAMAVYHL